MEERGADRECWHQTWGVKGSITNIKGRKEEGIKDRLERSTLRQCGREKETREKFVRQHLLINCIRQHNSLIYTRGDDKRQYDLMASINYEVVYYRIIHRKYF